MARVSSPGGSTSATKVDRAGRDEEHAGYLPLRELATYAGLSVRTLRDYLVDPRRPLPHYRIGGKILVRRSDFDGWAEQFRVRVSTVTVRSMVDDVMQALGGR